MPLSQLILNPTPEMIEAGAAFYNAIVDNSDRIAPATIAPASSNSWFLIATQISQELSSIQPGTEQEILTDMFNKKVLNHKVVDLPDGTHSIKGGYVIVRDGEPTAIMSNPPSNVNTKAKIFGMFLDLYNPGEVYRVRRSMLQDPEVVRCLNDFREDIGQSTNWPVMTLNPGFFAKFIVYAKR